MLLFLIAACSNVEGSRFGEGGERFDPYQYVPDTDPGTDDTVDTADTGDTDLPETTTEPMLLSLTLAWSEDKDGFAYISGGLEYYDNPDDTIGGKLYIVIEQDGAGGTTMTYEVVDYDGWDPEAEEAATDPTSELLLFDLYAVGVDEIDATATYDFTLMLKDEAGHESEDLLQTLAPE